MFQKIDSAKELKYQPTDSSIHLADWKILASFWHPVAYEHEVVERPVAARLLDVSIVLFRTTSGIAVAHDLCPHRGTQLSRGRIANDALMCPMHGLSFGGDGQCTRIPSANDMKAPIPKALRLHTLLAEVKYGIVWVCLTGTPLWPLPQWDELNDPRLEKLHFPAETWRTSAGRHVENFNDLAHFPWVHTQSFGGNTKASIADYDVRHTDYGLTFWVPYTEGFNRFPDGVEGDHRDVTYRYQLTFPFSTLLIIEPNGSNYKQFLGDAVCPISATECRIFQVSTDTTGRPDREFWSRDAMTINGEDRPLVESQRPIELPLNVRNEMHIPADRMSIEYRKALVEKFGLGRQPPTEERAED